MTAAERRLERCEAEAAELERRVKVAPRGRKLELQARLLRARTAALKAAGRRGVKKPRGDTMQVHCSDCRHEWIAAHLPMEMMKLANLLKGIACPKCGTSGKKIFIGPAPRQDAA